MKRLLRWLHEPELIGAPDCPIMKRWTIYGEGGLLPFVRLAKSLPWVFDRKLIVHYFLPDVEDRDPHDHPRGFWTFVFRGSYEDLVPCPTCKGLGSVIDPTELAPSLGMARSRVSCFECHGTKVVIGDRMRPGSLRYRPAKHAHITRSGSKGAWTVILMGPFERDWGFFREGLWYAFRKYEEVFGFAMRCPSDEEREGKLLKYTDRGVEVQNGPAQPPVPPPDRAYSGVVHKAAPVGLSVKPWMFDPVENAKAALRLYRERGSDPWGFGPWVEVFVRRKCAACPKWVHENRLHAVGPSHQPIKLCIDCFLAQTKPTPRTEMAG